MDADDGVRDAFEARLSSRPRLVNHVRRSGGVVEGEGRARLEEGDALLLAGERDTEGGVADLVVG